MRKRKDPFDKKNADFNIFVNNLYSKVNSNQVAWGIPAGSVAAILPLLTKWNAKWRVSQNRRIANSIDRTATVSARKKITKYLRLFIQRHIMRNSNLSDGDIVRCGLKPYDKTRTRIGRPDTIPSMEYKHAGAHVIAAYFRQGAKQKGVSNRGKPLNVYACKVVYFIGSNPPSDPSHFSNMVMKGSSPIHIQFKGGQAGMKVFFAACWITKRLLQGDWTRVHTMVIP